MLITVNGLNYNITKESRYSVVPPFSSLTPVKAGVSNNFDISTLAQSPQVFAFQFTGFINVPSDGQYTFYTNSDDGSLLYIIKIVVRDDGLHNLTEKSGTIGLKVGLHAITVGYLEMGGGATLNVKLRLFFRVETTHSCISIIHRISRRFTTSP